MKVNKNQSVYKRNCITELCKKEKKVNYNEYNNNNYIPINNLIKQCIKKQFN